MALAFHAAPPGGQWINDPNALLFADGGYRLFVQHRCDAPIFQATGWARFSSPDLLSWTFDGVVIAPDDQLWMYSGSVTARFDRLSAIHTLHAGSLEHQVERTSVDGGRSWSDAEALFSLGAPAANRRDPFVFAHDQGSALLLSEPCDWTDWASQPASCLQAYQSDGDNSWRHSGTIGPWHPPGVMWEVPVLASIDGYSVLFVSTIDRRSGGADCAVRGWIGTFENGRFQRDPRTASEGQLIDLGPDFYALMPSTLGQWPLADRAYVGWLASWNTARSMAWPGFSGGPISLPRAISINAQGAALTLEVRPLPAVVDHFCTPVRTEPQAGLGTAVIAGNRRFRLQIGTGEAMAVIEGEPASNSLLIKRTGGNRLDWTRRHHGTLRQCLDRTLRIFVDGPAIEIFLCDDGVCVSLALPESARRAVRLSSDNLVIAIGWQIYQLKKRYSSAS